MLLVWFLHLYGRENYKEAICGLMLLEDLVKTLKKQVKELKKKLFVSYFETNTKETWSL